MMPRYRCDNCGHVETDPPIAHNLQDRLDDGGVATTRECSECGALTYRSFPTYNHQLAVAFSVTRSKTRDPMRDLNAVIVGLRARLADLERMYYDGHHDELREVFEDCHDTFVEEIEDIEEPV